MTKATLIKGRDLIGACLEFQGLVYYQHGGANRSMQAGTALELRISHPDPPAAKRERMWLSRILKPQSLYPETHFLH